MCAQNGKPKISVMMSRVVYAPCLLMPSPWSKVASPSAVTSSMYASSSTEAEKNLGSLVPSRSTYTTPPSVVLIVPVSDSRLRQVAVMFIELLLILVHSVSIHVGIMAEDERSHNAVIGSWLFLRRLALAD